MFNRLRSMLSKELLQFLRDPLLLSVTLIVPALELLLIGGGVGGSVSGIATAVVDRDRSRLSREVGAALDNTQELFVSHYPETFDEAHALIDDGLVNALVVIPEGFGEDVRSGQAVQVQLVLDGSNVVVAGEAQTAAQGAIETLGWGVSVASTGDLAPGGIDLRQEALYNQALDARPNNLTALLAFIVFEVAMLATVMSVVREREAGTLEQVSITPLRRVEMIAGKALSPLIVALVNFVILFGVVRLLFDLPIRGSFILLTLLTVLYLISEICVSLMISSVSRTQQQAITIAFIWIMLTLTMSGYMVQIVRLPDALQLASNALPLRHYIVIVRAIMLKGAGLRALWPNALALLILDVVVVGVTSLVLRRLGS
jgi:ABC-2 type transport system permease protein